MFLKYFYTISENSTKNSVCYSVRKDKNSVQMVINFYELSEHIAVHLFCLKTCLQCIHSKLGVAHGL